MTSFHMNSFFGSYTFSSNSLPFSCLPVMKRFWKKVKINTRCHRFIDVAGHTHVIQQGPVNGIVADAIAAAEVALRLVKPGKKGFGREARLGLVECVNHELLQKNPFLHEFITTIIYFDLFWGEFVKT
ncbi:hypothetical protein L1987_78123 [Smallanthus sonchifolius]|uniref:Uncharacterized protein n=1 Tax=Smallanthus sonchifolius TaxID=185202 RepID=A0ACB8ZBT1_9ASTR|nr:hypothetical protein L1987_78123 [Smallanthus sonchifolius]